MAISQFKVKVGHKGKAVAHANYVMREDKYGDSFGKHANKKDKEVEYASFGNMPAWSCQTARKRFPLYSAHARRGVLLLGPRFFSYTDALLLGYVYKRVEGLALHFRPLQLLLQFEYALFKRIYHRIPLRFFCL